LVLCDARSVDEADVVNAERRAPNHIGEISLATFNSKHRWYYYPAMNSNEMLVFTTFDSENGGRNPGSIHTAIDVSNTFPDAVPRESIESRAFVFYE
jgi:hypothetical protein